MADTANNQNQTPVDDYFGGGNYTIKAGVNQDIKVKSWSIESNENNGKTSYYLKITYVHPQQGIPEPEDGWSTISELISFPHKALNADTINKNSVKYGFINPLRGFLSNFVDAESIKQRFAEVFQKLGIKDFDLENEDNFNTQAKEMVNGLFALAKDSIFNISGVLVCGYTAPREVDGKVKQYLTPHKFGQSGCYKSAFRTNNDEELPAEKVNFTDDTDKKYNYWSYTRTTSSKPKEDVAPTVDNSGW